MGFLSFLSKGNQKSKSELDLPHVPPPPLDSSFEETPSIEEELPPLPEIDASDKEFTEFQEGYKEEGVNELPPLTGMKEMSLKPKWDIGSEVPMATLTRPGADKSFERAEKHIKPNSLYIRVDTFRGTILRNTMFIKNELKASNEILARLDRIEQTENILFKEWHNKMQELQNKIVYVDKVLFKG